MYDGFSALVSLDGGLTVLPALVAIAVALLTRRVEPALALGVLLGGFIAARFAVVDALTRVGSYLGSALGFELSGAEWSFSIDHLEISAFSIVVAATVSIMGAAGGTRALIQLVERRATGRRGAMVSSWLAGMIVFFDDYANCLVVGSAMGPMCDKNKVSREKLAYIVDSTAAPVASLALVSTWVGYEVGLIQDAIATMPHIDASAFSVFLSSVPYRFYSLFTLVFVGAIAWSGRDFGPMRAAEQRMAHRPTAALPPSQSSPLLAAIPVFLLVSCTLGLLVADGLRSIDPEVWKAGTTAITASSGLSSLAPGLSLASEVLGSANAYHSMMAGSLVAFTTACLGALGSGSLTAASTFVAAREGSTTVARALVVLFLAWSLSAAMNDTGAASWLASVLQGTVPPWAFPAITFVLAAATAFATGTSFGTMGILIPIAVRVALELSPDPFGNIALGTTAAVLAGSCLGDHASPISDTTVLSAIGADVPLVDHVKTQLPYALTTGAISIVFGYIPIGLGVSPWALLPLGAAACLAVVYGVGRVPHSVKIPS